MHILVISRLAQMVVLYIQRRQSIRALSELNDHLLQDIGIDRNMIESVVDSLILEQKKRLSRTERLEVDNTEKPSVLQPQCSDAT